MAKEDTISDEEKSSPKQTSPQFKKKLDNKNDTNEKTYGFNDPPIETDGCERNLAKEHENEEDEEFIEGTSEINDT